MDRKLQKEISERVEGLKASIPYLEKAISSNKPKDIDNSVAHLVYKLHRIYKKALGKSTGEVIQDFSNKVWWFKLKKEEENRKHLTVKQTYKKWAKEYDAYANLAIFLEEKYSDKFIGDVKGKEVLDYGCGTGRYAIPLAKKGAKITAIDFTPAMMNVAKKKAKKSKLDIDFVFGDITKIQSQKKFDLIISMLVLDHIGDLSKVAEVIGKASKIGTELIVSNIHPWILMKDIDKHSGKTQGYIIEGFKTDQFYHSIGEYIELFEKQGFFLTKMKDIEFEEKYQGMMKFKKFLGMKDKPVMILMKFKKIR